MVRIGMMWMTHMILYSQADDYKLGKCVHDYDLSHDFDQR